MTQLKEQKKVATARKAFNENESEERNMHIKYLTKINCNSIYRRNSFSQINSSCSVHITRIYFEKFLMIKLQLLCMLNALDNGMVYHRTENT